MSSLVLPTADNEPLRNYQLLTSLVVPRPIAWVSTVSEDGVPNVAPHSFFTVASTNPPVVQFTSITEKDTVRNARATGRFTVSLVTESTWRAANATAVNLPAGLDEFTFTGTPSEPGDTLDVPRPAESPAHLECTVREIRPVGNCFVVLGDVQAFVLDEAVLDANGRPSARALAPVSKLGADEWAPLGEVFAEPRPRYEGSAPAR
ncbi:flavin reductase family protein [Actinotalea sp. M2MS4P-6]|uniref:flavin reductase family protein n=1 Tax=Actinotalea sp. M2MS4P-6 TaxID=2983762 RepID=UPI0021E5020F|nr:flavin reductase family protein [Actinotalea sp. M2MS4P-6]MCV2395460.1 flavin reductase family protein [Actinotalea sp. M2MS4P-6]